MNYLIALSLLAVAVLAAPLYPADVFSAGQLSPFAYSAYQPAFYNQALFAPHFGYSNYIAPSHQFADFAAVAPNPTYVHSYQVPVVAAPQIKYVEVPVPTPVVHTYVVPEVKTVVISKVAEPAPAPAPAPVEYDSRESAESSEDN